MIRFLQGIGLVGAGFTGLCCVAPFLPWLLGALGLGSLTGALWRDSVFLPLLGGFLLLEGVATWLRRRRTSG
jgi:hypothetical protein